MYLAINTAAKTSLTPAALEADFINPANWIWNDGSSGIAGNPIYSATSEHDIRECWVVPNTNPDDDWVIIYNADYGTADGGKALGYFGVLLPLPIPPVRLGTFIYRFVNDSVFNFLYFCRKKNPICFSN